MKSEKELKERYNLLQFDIQNRLYEFSQVPENEYFYELCYCLCTPQSKAKNAFQVVEKLKSLDFYNNPLNPVEILSDKKHYIRFHNQKSLRLLKAREIFPDILKILKMNLSTFEKREEITKLINGYGLKESSHFLRNIGYRKIAILDRHILKYLVNFGVYNKLPNISSKKKYYDIEQKFFTFAKRINIDPDELDILIWSYETGEILK